MDTFEEKAEVDIVAFQETIDNPEVELKSIQSEIQHYLKERKA